MRSTRPQPFKCCITIKGRYSRIIEQLQEVNDEGYDDLFGFWCLDVTVHIALRKWLGYFGTIYRVYS